MPYMVEKTGKGYVVKKKDGGKVVAGNKTKLSKSRAEAAMRARYWAESKKG